MTLTEVLDKVMEEWDIGSYHNKALHSWRCEYYANIVGPCDCYARLLAECTAAVLAWIAANKA